MFVVRETVGLPLVDLGLGVPTIYDDMIARGPHTGPVYQIIERYGRSSVMSLMKGLAGVG
jgi:hypothetical protein